LYYDVCCITIIQMTYFDSCSVSSQVVDWFTWFMVNNGAS